MTLRYTRQPGLLTRLSSRSTCSPALAIVRLTLGGLLGTPLPAGWDGETCALKGTGRMPLDGDDRTLLGPAGDRFPLLA